MTQQAGVAQNHSTDDAVVVEQQINASPERVFQALTDAKQLTAWWGQEENCENMSWEFEARLGGRYRVRDRTKKPMEQLGGKQEFEAHGTITVYDPPRTLEYTWFADWSDIPTQETRVRYDLTPRAGGTLVRVTHSGLSNQPIARKDYSGGWVGVLRTLGQYFERAA